MASPAWIEKLKLRWNVNSVWQVVIILVVFACTGFTVLFLKRPILAALGQGNDKTLITVLYYIFILPIYNILLLGYGFIFGQFKFFWEFEKRMFGRLFNRSKKR